MGAEGIDRVTPDRDTVDLLPLHLVLKLQVSLTCHRHPMAKVLLVGGGGYSKAFGQIPTM